MCLGALAECTSCSTYVDLKTHRTAVIDALRKGGIFVDPMEDWTADKDEPKTVSVERMRGIGVSDSIH